MNAATCSAFRPTSPSRECRPEIARDGWRGRPSLPPRPASARAAGPIRSRGLAGTVPFASAEQAWFWTVASLAARRDGTGAGSGRTPRPCDPDDIIRALDLLYRHGGIGPAHARVLRRWSERGVSPDPRFASERQDFALWRDALAQLEGMLRAKGIVD